MYNNSAVQSFFHPQREGCEYLPYPIWPVSQLYRSSRPFLPSMLAAAWLSVPFWPICKGTQKREEGAPSTKKKGQERLPTPTLSLVKKESTNYQTQLHSKHVLQVVELRLSPKLRGSLQQSLCCTMVSRQISCQGEFNEINFILMVSYHIKLP